MHDQKTLLLFLRWEEISPAKFYLFAGNAGRAVCIGEVYRVDNPVEWRAEGFNLCKHTSTGHASAKNAQDALESAVMAFENGEPTEEELGFLRRMLDNGRSVIVPDMIARRMAGKGWVGMFRGGWIILEAGAVWAHEKAPLLPDRTTRIHIVKRTHDWMAFLEGRRDLWGSGSSDRAALADLLMSHREATNIYIIYDPAS